MLLKVVGVLIVAYLVIVIVLWGAQERLVLPGPSRPLPDPRAIGLDGERVTVVADDGIELHGWYLPPTDSTARPAPGLLWFYGNMETVGVLGDVLAFLKPPRMGLLAMDYRGYGENSGIPTESDLERDAEAALAFLRSRKEIDASKIGVYGRSIGSTVAMHLAANDDIAAVVLDSPMSSARDVAREHYWFFPPFLVKMKLDNVSRATHVQAPILVLHGNRDRIIPDWMGHAVADAAPNGSFISVGGAGHNTTYAVDPQLYREALWSHLGALHSEPAEDR